MTKAEQIAAEALKLPPKSRGKLIRALIESLDGPADPGAAGAWDAEIRRRVELDRKGKLAYLPAEQSLARLRKILAR